MICKNIVKAKTLHQGGKHSQGISAWQERHDSRQLGSSINCKTRYLLPQNGLSCLPIFSPCVFGKSWPPIVEQGKAFFWLSVKFGYQWIQDTLKATNQIESALVAITAVQWVTLAIHLIIVAFSVTASKDCCLHIILLKMKFCPGSSRDDASAPQKSEQVIIKVRKNNEVNLELKVNGNRWSQIVSLCQGNHLSGYKRNILNIQVATVGMESYVGQG